MRSPAAAIAWEFWQRHRWGFAALAGYLLILATMKPVVLARGQAVTFDSQSFAFFVFVPLCSMLTYLLAVFTYGLSGDLAARQSMYPPRIFTMPASTAALAGWPMLYGALTMAIFWLAIRLLAVWPSGFAAPWVWPALLAAVMLCWTQALTWMPYGLPGLRIVVTVLWLSVIDTIVLLALHFEAGELVMLAILAPQVPLGYFAARFAVARARRGVVPDWRGAFGWLRRIANILTGGHRRDHFASPASGGDTAGRSLHWSASYCPSSWPCCSPRATRLYSSSSFCSACCSRHRSWPPSSRRQSARRVPM
jgi:hypothetical protein